MNPPNKLHFSDAQLDWLVKHYPNTENAELCFRLGSPVERPGVTAKQRWYLRTLGYRVDGFTAYYDASTARSQRIETKYKAFKFTAI